MLERLIPEEWWGKLRQRGGPVGWLGLAALATVAIGIGYCEYGAAETVVRAAVMGCADGTTVAADRAARVFQRVIAVYGEPTREEDRGNTLYFEAPRSADAAVSPFWLRLSDDADPCHWSLSVQVRVAPPGPDDATLVQAIDRDPAVRRGFESRGRWYANDEGLFLARTHPVRELQGASLYWLEDHLDLASHWATTWLDEVREIQAGRAQAPGETRYRPGKDPKSILDSANRLLAEAGVPKP